MAEAPKKKPDKPSSAAGEQTPASAGSDQSQPGPGQPAAWGQLWQMPALLLGLLLFGAGFYLSIHSRPGPDLAGMLDEAGDALKASNFDSTHAALKKMEPYLAKAIPAVHARFNALNADLIYQEQKAKGWNKESNHQQVIENYQQALKLGYPLDAAQKRRWADALASLQQYDQAMEMLAQLDAAGPAQRYLAIRQMIEQRMAGGPVTAEELQAMFKQFERSLERESDRAQRRRQMIWLAAVRGELQMSAGEAKALIDGLQLQIVRFLDEGGEQDLMPLLLLLGQAYQKEGQYDQAQTYYKLVQAKLRPDDPHAAELAARSLVGLGQIALAQPSASAGGDSLQQALDYFVRAETEYRSTSVYLDTLLGRAACEARLGMHAEALEHFSQVLRKIEDAPSSTVAQREQIIAILHRQHALHYDRGDFALALEYIKPLGAIFGEEWPPELLLQLAESYFALGNQTLVQAENSQSHAPALRSHDAPAPVHAPAPAVEHTPASAHAPAAGHAPAHAPAAGHGAPAAAAVAAAPAPARPLRSLREQLRIDAARLFELAGDLFLKHARAVTIKDVRAHSDSLWKAARCFEQAQQWKKAIEVLVQFSKALPGDPRQNNALYRLGAAHLADRQYAVAADIFRRLVDDSPTSPEAHESHVPLARALIALERMDDAESELKRVVTDHPVLKPDSKEYAQALIDLGRLLYKRKQFEPAIERLTEAVDRYGKSAEGPVLRFLLADAYRQSVQEIENTLRTQPPLSRRQALAAERSRRLEMAQALYAQVVSALEPRKTDTLSETERLYRRNAYFYRADCAYDLARYDDAILLYDAAVKRFDNDPASLMALVQIVNAYCEMGRLNEARVANDRARAQLKRIPDDAFNDPSLPMNRQHWEDWLKFTSQFNLFASNQGKPAAKP